MSEVRPTEPNDLQSPNDAGRYLANARGSFTTDQVLLLLYRRVGYGLLFVLPIALAAWELGDTSLALSASFAIGAVVAGGYFLVPAGIDLSVRRPVKLTGRVAKSHFQSRGPVHYYVHIGERKVETTKADWLQIQDDEVYDVYIAQYSKWLLSFAPTEST